MRHVPAHPASPPAAGHNLGALDALIGRPSLWALATGGASEVGAVEAIDDSLGRRAPGRPLESDRR
jgi:hypothetical protein